MQLDLGLSMGSVLRLGPVVEVDEIGYEDENGAIYIDENGATYEEI